MFKLVTIATIATMAVADEASDANAAMMKKMLGPKCTMDADVKAKMEAQQAGKPAEKPTEEETKKMMVKMAECDPTKIDDIMCPKKAAIDAEKDAGKKIEMSMKSAGCTMQCMVCTNFPDSLSGASTILMGATIAFAGAALF